MFATIDATGFILVNPSTGRASVDVPEDAPALFSGERSGMRRLRTEGRPRGMHSKRRTLRSHRLGR